MTDTDRTSKQRPLSEFETWWDARSRKSFAENNPSHEPYSERWGMAFKPYALEAWLAARSPDETTGNDDATKLRRLLAFCYSSHRLYLDDGEMQDNSVQPFIDWQRDSVDDIARKIHERGLAQIMRPEEPSEQRCHFMAFRQVQFQCTKPEGHDGSHSCRLQPETQPLKASGG